MESVIENYFIEESIQEKKKQYLVLIIYDIVSNKKRTKFAKYLENYGFRVQKSAFEAKLTLSKYEKLIRGIDAYASGEDSIRVYRLNGYGEVRTWGIYKEVLEEEIIII
jgi:CRISPR-associated protein Cas2